MVDAETVNYGNVTFEHTLRLFTGLSSEEIWELQRILMLRLELKLSESLSFEGKTAMKQAKQDMLEVGEVLQRDGMERAGSIEESLEQTNLAEQIAMTLTSAAEVLFPLEKESSDLRYIHRVLSATTRSSTASATLVTEMINFGSKELFENRFVGNELGGESEIASCVEETPNEPKQDNPPEIIYPDPDTSEQKDMSKTKSILSSS